MKQCALFICYGDGPRHPMVTDTAHAVGTKLRVLSHGVVSVNGAPILGKNFGKMMKRDVASVVVQTKTEENSWQPFSTLTPKDEIQMERAINLLLGEWVGKLRMPPDAFDVWLVPFDKNADLDRANASRVRFERSPRAELKFVPNISKAALPEDISA